MRIRLAAAAVTTLGLLGLAGPGQAWHQPYGGCEEGTLAPHSAAANECRAHGWVIKRRLAVNPHAVVKGSGLPDCREEDGSGQGICSWNFAGSTDGNGVGLTYWVGVNDRVHYAWPSRPIHGRWVWVNQELGDALAEGEHQEPNNWRQCITRPRHGLAQVMCPDGFGQSN